MFGIFKIKHMFIIWIDFKNLIIIISWTPAQFTGSHNAYANTIWYLLKFNLITLFRVEILILLSISWTHGNYKMSIIVQRLN